MTTFKQFMEVGFLHSYHEPKRFSPPAIRVTDPMKQREEEVRWLIGIYTLLVHMAEAGEFINQNGRLYVQQSVVEGKWHPKAIEEFTRTGTIVKYPNPMTLPIPTKQKDGSLAVVPQNVYVYEISLSRAMANQQQDYSKYNLWSKFKGVAGAAWNQAITPRLTKFHGTQMPR